MSRSPPREATPRILEQHKLPSWTDTHTATLSAGTYYLCYDEANTEPAVMKDVAPIVVSTAADTCSGFVATSAPATTTTEVVEVVYTTEWSRWSGWSR